MALGVPVATIQAEPGSIADRVARLEQELRLAKRALGLLGLEACSRCGRYFRCADRGACFHAPSAVCFDCIASWWTECRCLLKVCERQTIESRLVTWLVSQHGARVLRHAPATNDAIAPGLCIVANCSLCDGYANSSGQCSGC